MAELTDLEVDRVDGVDRPATRRRFVVIKAEGAEAAPPAGTPAGEVNALLVAVTKAVDAVHKDASAGALAEGTITALNELVAAAAVKDVTFAKSADAAGEGTIVTPAGATITHTGTDAAPDAAATAAAPAETAEAKIAKAVASELAGPLSAIAKALEGKSGAASPPPSAQPAGEPVAKSSGPRKVGEGVFTGIVFSRS